MDDIRKQIVKLIYERGEVHIGSALSCVDILLDIKDRMKKGDTFILSKAHAQRAADVINMPGTIDGLVTYCNSVGNGVGIGLGIALAKPDKIVYVVCGDSEISEGTNWEAFNYIYEHNIKNIKIYIDYNKLGAYKSVDLFIPKEFSNFITIVDTVKGKGIDFLEGKLESHYHHVTKEEYEKLVL
jgi:transketolase